MVRVFEVGNSYLPVASLVGCASNPMSVTACTNFPGFGGAPPAQGCPRDSPGHSQEHPGVYSGCIRCIPVVSSVSPVRARGQARMHALQSQFSTHCGCSCCLGFRSSPTDIRLRPDVRDFRNLLIRNVPGGGPRDVPLDSDTNIFVF